jgi:hypothetical protein
MNMIRENVPCWYELSWNKEEKAIVLRVHKDVRDFIETSNFSFEKAPLIRSLKEEFKLGNFIGDFKGNMGFDEAFKFLGEKDDFIEFLIKMPRVRNQSGKNCSRCNGSGEEEFSHHKCFACDGMGKAFVQDWQSVYVISASLTAVLALLDIFGMDKKSQAYSVQLLEVRTSTRKGDYGGWLGGTYSLALCNWLSSLEKGSIKEMVEAMIIAHDCMFGLREFEACWFKASLDYDNGWLNVDCPGNACGLNPANSHVEKGEGYDFGCHNTDTPIQQLTLLAGLAALHDKARNEMK